jgi:hypothetical protein
LLQKARFDRAFFVGALMPQGKKAASLQPETKKPAGGQPAGWFLVAEPLAGADQTERKNVSTVHHRRRQQGRTRYRVGRTPVNNWLVESCGRLAGHVYLDSAGWYRTYDLDWTPIGRHSTERRALQAIDTQTLLSVYGTTKEALFSELSRGLVALDQEPTNELRLSRITEEDLRWLVHALLEDGWRKSDIAKLIARWREICGGANA